MFYFPNGKIHQNCGIEQGNMVYFFWSPESANPSNPEALEAIPVGLWRLSQFSLNQG
jgi:hypothetical protein